MDSKKPKKKKTTQDVEKWKRNHSFMKATNEQKNYKGHLSLFLSLPTHYLSLFLLTQASSSLSLFLTAKFPSCKETECIGLTLL